MNIDWSGLALLAGLVLTILNIWDRIKAGNTANVNIINKLNVLESGNANIQNKLNTMETSQNKFSRKLIRLEERYKSNTHRLNAIDGKGGPEELEDDD